MNLRGDMEEVLFKRRLQEQGYNEAESIEFGSNSILDRHTHDLIVLIMLQAETSPSSPGTGA